MHHRKNHILGLACLLMTFGSTLLAQHNHEPLVDRKPDSTRESIHREGLHVNPVATYAIVGATVHRTPTSDPQVEMVLVFNGKIVDIGSDIKIPAGSQRIDATGHHLYAGFIDGFTETEVPFETKQGTAYWNQQVRPQVSVARDLDFSKIGASGMRSAGFTAALVAPSKGIVKGSSSLLLLGSDNSNHTIIRTDVAQHLQLTTTRNRGSGYPNSPMGAYALARQAMYDSQWYRDANQAAKTNATVERPESNQALAALQPAIAGQQPVVFETSNELFALRSVRFANEFGLNTVLLGSGNEYRRIDEIKATDRPIILPLNFPNAPVVSSPELARDVDLETLMHWDHAPSNPAVLETNGIDFVFTTKGLKSKKDYLKNIRKAVKRGLSKSTALHGLTLGVAKLYQVDDQLGTVEKNKIANFTLLDGDLFTKSSKIASVVVDGQYYDLGHQHQSKRMIDGTWKIKIKNRQLSKLNLLLKKSNKTLTGYLVDNKPKPNPTDEEKPDDADDSDDNQAKKKPTAKIKIKSLKQADGRVTGTFMLPDAKTPGVFLFTILFAEDETGIGQLTDPQGRASSFSLKPVDEWAREVNGHKHQKPMPDDEEPEDDTESEGDSDSDSINESDADSNDSNKPTETNAESKQPFSEASFPVNFPLGAYGVDGNPDQPETVLMKNVTIWTLDKTGKIKNGAILFGNGQIKSILDLKDNPPLPDADLVIDGKGGHVTPGIIDCHSHMATDSGINESAQAITAEVRIGDMIDPDDITIYRQLAGGVTAANILHGSANPIGGQNQVIKLRWGANEEDMKFQNAPAGIKFALGENVKQSNWQKPTNRYPQTRMGVEQLIDDAFNAAKDYQRRHEDYRRHRTGLPPRRDLELDALVEICNGERWIHCHSYRQDEILALLRTLESHDITIGSLQHILEGYKVADQMQKHGAMASSFADWWAYKYEVKDAIPYAGALMHEAGLVVSFNSDDDELGRRLNQEAAKAVRYGGVNEVEAMKFVTLNAAKQLRIDDKVGSLEPGKHADLVLWSGHPLSNLSRVKQTWLDGRKYFDIADDQQRRKENQRRRNALIQKILTSGVKMEASNKSTTDPAKLWPRHDEFCGHDDHIGEHDHTDLQHSQQGANNE